MTSILKTLLFIAWSPAYSSTGDGGIFVMTGNTSTTTYAHFIVVNQAGQRTGQLFDGTRVEEIPGTESKYGTESGNNHDTGAPDFQRALFEASGLAPGIYRIEILPTATTAYWISIAVRNDNLSRARLKSDGYSIAGTPISYEFDFQPAAAAPIPPKKQVSFSSLRESAQVALHLGQLGDTGFASRLDKMLLKAEDQADNGQKKQSADRLDQFIHRIESAFKKEPDPYTDDEPGDKKSASSMKRFILDQARNALRDDARTLIVSLGETPKR